METASLIHLLIFILVIVLIAILYRLMPLG